jgi:hypothetical protein
MGCKIPKQWGLCIRLDFEVEEVEGSRAFIARGRKKETGKEIARREITDVNYHIHFFTPILAYPFQQLVFFSSN